MTHPRQIAHRLRWYMLIVGMLFEFAAVAWVFGPLIWPSDAEWGPYGLLYTPLALTEDDKTAYLINAILVVGLLLLAQYVFLRPGRLLTIHLTGRGRPLKSAVIVAAAMAMLLTLGAFSLVLELFNKWGTLISPTNQGPTLSSMGGIWVGMIGVWAIWAALFFRYWRDGDRYTQLGRIVRAMVAGSILETIVAAPVQAFASRQDDCYCARGSYTTLVCAGAVLFWAFGPGIVLLFLRESYRRARLFPHCHKCGYDLRGNLGICSECGTPAAVSDEEAPQREEYRA